MRPNQLVVRAYLLRGAVLWIVTRAAITGVLLFTGANALKLSIASLVEVVLLIIALEWIETNRHREHTLPGNLGVSPLLLSVFFAAPALLGELVLRVGAAVLT